MQIIIQKVEEYFRAKIDNAGLNSHRNIDMIQPLFKTLNEPSVEQVGYLIDLKCGHTSKPTDLESVMFTLHLEMAGFVAGAGPAGSPSRSMFGSIQSKSRSQSSDKKSNKADLRGSFPPVKGEGVSVSFFNSRRRSKTLV